MNILRDRRGVSILFAIFALVIAAALGLAAANITQSSQGAAVNISRTAGDFFAAQSGLEWVRQVTDGYTTADRSRWLNLNGVHMDIDGRTSFTLTIAYSDPDNDPSTDDMVIVTSTGSVSGDATRRVTSMTLTVPAAGSSALFADDFDQPNAASFDNRYQIGISGSAHGDMAPYTTTANTIGGDTGNIFTHSSESGGTQGSLTIGGASEARIVLHTGSCFKWSVSAIATVCDYPECADRPGCEARQGIDVTPDSNGFQNYFIKIRARLLSGAGFGIYFRSSYANQGDPYLVDFGTLTSYIWQYDPGMGYLYPCDITTMVPGGDLTGMLFTRRVENGSERCGAGCGLFTTSALPDTYPFFCPENRTGLAMLAGWGWSNGAWLGYWRTIYIYVYRDTARVYIGREEIVGSGGENLPEPVGFVDLNSVPTLLQTGDIGLRVWGGSVVELDYVEIYGNDDDKDASTFIGG